MVIGILVAISIVSRITVIVLVGVIVVVGIAILVGVTVVVGIAILVAVVIAVDIIIAIAVIVNFTVVIISVLVTAIRVGVFKINPGHDKAAIGSEITFDFHVRPDGDVGWKCDIIHIDRLAVNDPHISLHELNDAFDVK